MITFEINKWVLVAIICGIMLLGAWIEALVACIYSNRDNAKKARTDESADKITQLENESKRQNVDIGLMRQDVEFLLTEYGELPDCVEVSPGQWMRFKKETKKDLEQDSLQEKYDSLAKKYEDVIKKQTVDERRIDQLTSAFHRFMTGTYEREKDLADDFHDLEEHMHEWLKWLNNKPNRKDKDPAVEFNYNLDCYVPTRTEATHIIKNLHDKFYEQGYITVAEYRQEFDRDWLFMQEDYGWNEFDPSAVDVQFSYEGYRVIMPKPIALTLDFKEDEEQ